ncbi:MAG: hypothetical protein ABIC04_02245 [Nanoarchaeota archaeon]
MPKKRQLLDVVCLNKKCKHFNVKGLNVIKFGKKKNGVQNYRCTMCNVCFAKTKGTEMYCSKLSKKEIQKIYDNFKGKTSFRAVSRETKHSLNAIYRVASKASRNKTDNISKVIEYVKSRRR